MPAVQATALMLRVSQHDTLLCHFVLEMQSDFNTRNDEMMNHADSQAHQNIR